jgi:NAD(P)-dependent dehydrogenase (short-subunit alcohol dehydrogenase family)
MSVSEGVLPMAGEGAVVVVGGTHGLGRAVAELYAARDREVIVTGRDAGRAEAAAREIGGKTRGLALDLSKPQGIAENLKDVGPVHDIVLLAIERDYNTVVDYDVERAIRLVTIKLVGYTEVVHALESRLTTDGSVLLFGGLAKERPYPGSTTVTTVNDAMVGLTKTLARELAPRRVNSLHPGVVGNHPAWSDKPEVLARLIERTPLGRLITIDECATAAAFLLDHPSVNGVSLYVDGGWLVT